MLKFIAAPRRRRIQASAVLAVIASSCLVSGCSAGATTTDGKVPEGAVASIHNSLPAKYKASGELNIATDPTYGPPCEFYENDNSTKMIGFEVDLWNAITKKMGLTPKPAALAFDSLIPSVASGRYDLAMECLTDSAKRQGSGDFVDMFYSETGFLTMKDNPKGVTSDPLTTCGLRVATVTGTDVSAHVPDYLDKRCEAAGKPKLVATEFPASSQVLVALRSGRIDLTLKSVSQSTYMIQKTGAPYAIFRTDSLPRKYSGPIFNKKNRDLAEAWLAAVKEIQKDGTYEQIMSEWGIDELILDEPGINLATEKPLPAPSA
jgi:polar amino acid transport system substrate-binding protein